MFAASLLTISLAAHAARPAPLPEPLAPRPFALPPVEERVLSNGLKVLIATQHEVPRFEVRVLLRDGGWTDPVGHEGLASAALDMMNEGTVDHTAEDLSRAAARLGASLGSSAGIDGAEVSVSGLSRNLAPSLDLLAEVVLTPTFPEADWEVMRARYLAGLKSERENPASIAARVMPTLLWDGYRGRLPTEASYAAISTADMAEWHMGHVDPARAVVLVGGDVEPDEITALLEARFGQWTRSGVVPPAGAAVPEVRVKPRTPAVYLVDKPGAAQSVIRVVTEVPDRNHPDRYDLIVANAAFGGSFTSRLNLNLREDKGYTYGARCGFTYAFGPSFWSCNASVATDVTGPALLETRAELDALLGPEPLTADEATQQASGEILGFPLGFEGVGAILAERAAIWRYDLPADSTERYVPGLRNVTAESATGAFRDHVRTDQLTWLVVGDAAKIRDAVSALGLPLIELDRDGQPTGGQ